MVTGAVLTLTQVVPPDPNTEGEPSNIWCGTLTFSAGSPLGSSETLVDITAFEGA